VSPFLRIDGRIETAVSSWSINETAARLMKKARGLKQSPLRYCCRRWTLAFFEVTVSQIGPRKVEEDSIWATD